jgi:type VI secretion system protein ImpK
MSDKDRPLNPFGRGDRTIIRPNPGGRLPTPPSAPPPTYPASLPPGSAAPYPNPSPAGYPLPTPGTPYPAATPPPLPPTPGGYPVQAPAPPPPPYQPVQQQYAPAPSTHSPEEWISTPATVPPPQFTAGPPMPGLRVDDLVAPNANPIMRAAGPLLLLLGRLRIALMRAPFATLMEQVADAIKFFEKDIRSAGISEQQANSAKYILCATADDIVQHIPTDDRHVWAQYSMLSRFFGERVGGVRFFEILNHHKLDPLINYPVLELQHACLALGFQGMYRANPTGVATLQQIQRDLYETLRRVHPKVMRDLSPRWQGQALAMNTNRIRVPVWVVASAAGALLFALFLTLRILLSGNADSAAEMTASLHALEPVALKRIIPAPPPPPPPPPAPKPKIELDPCSQVIASASAIVIRLCDQFLFDSAQATLKNGFKPIAAQIAAYLNEHPGKIKFVGHTDNIPLHDQVRFASNQVLSKARALAVANMVKVGMTDPNRIEIEGKGPDAPVASNATAEGRAKNRRVEIVISRSSEAKVNPQAGGAAR